MSNSSPNDLSTLTTSFANIFSQIMAMVNAAGTSINCKLQCGGFFEPITTKSRTEMETPVTKKAQITLLQTIIQQYNSYQCICLLYLLCAIQSVHSNEHYIIPIIASSPGTGSLPTHKLNPLHPCAATSSSTAIGNGEMTANKECHLLQL